MTGFEDLLESFGKVIRVCFEYLMSTYDFEISLPLRSVRIIENWQGTGMHGHIL